MGNYDRKNFMLKIGIRESCTDTRYIDYMTKKNFNYSIEEVSEFIESTTPQYHPLAEKIIRFFTDYKNGILLPDKYDNGEPLKMPFNKEDLTEVISILSYTGGRLFLMRKRSYSAEIQNESYRFIWENKKSFKPQRTLPEYMVIIRIFFSKQRKPKMEFMKQLTDDMAEYFNTSYAVIIDQEAAEEMPPLYEDDPRAVVYNVLDI